jgi:hypothetical protein
MDGQDVQDEEFEISNLKSLILFSILPILSIHVNYSSSASLTRSLTLAVLYLPRSSPNGQSFHHCCRRAGIGIGTV